jgi:fructan beta-fructosidase
MKQLFFCLFGIALTVSACKQPTEAGKNPSPGQAAYYGEPHRLQYHFSPEKKWMNDPNGMVFYEGEYHLFYQYYPDSTVWGPMHWGHAVSRDMVRWEHLPVALYPDSLGYIFSGSAVVDRNNTSGFGRDGKPPLVAIYTYHKMEGEKAGRSDYQSQAIAYSNDRGRTWTKYEANPVLPNAGVRDFRDPKVRWHDPSGRWVMTLAAQDRVQFWGSPDLKAWSLLSEFGREWGAHGGVWECPDLFPLPVEGGGEKWVLLLSINPGGPNGGSATQYFVGDFDGKTFTLDPDFARTIGTERDAARSVWLDWGPDNYAGVTWSDVPKEDGRSLFLGWMGNWEYAQKVPTQAWRSAMTLPRELRLRRTADGWRVFSSPAKEVETLRQGGFTLEPQPLEGELDLTPRLGFPPALLEAVVEFEIPEGTTPEVGLLLSNDKNEEYRIGFDAAKKQFFSDRTKGGPAGFSDKFADRRHTAARPDSGSTVKLHVFFDLASAELFADDGATVMTAIFFPSQDFNKLRLYSAGGAVRVTEGRFFKLGTIWR